MSKKITIKKIDSALNDIRAIINLIAYDKNTEGVDRAENIVNVLWDVRDEIKKKNKRK